MFENTRSVHNRTLGEMLELGIRKVLMELKDYALIEQEEKRTEREILSLSQKRANLLKLREEFGNIRT
jgi:hypothetical protein